LPRNRAGRLLIDDYLRVKGQNGRVFAIGDCACNEDTALPPIASVAEQQGQYLSDCFNEHYVKNHFTTANNPSANATANATNTTLTNAAVDTYNDKIARMTGSFIKNSKDDTNTSATPTTLDNLYNEENVKNELPLPGQVQAPLGNMFCFRNVVVMCYSMPYRDVI
jgi:NADH dehydrogenase FAD-containing subunit